MAGIASAFAASLAMDLAADHADANDAVMRAASELLRQCDSVVDQDAGFGALLDAHMGEMLADIADAAATVDATEGDGFEATRHELLSRILHIEALRARRVVINDRIRQAMSAAKGRGFPAKTMRDIIARRARDRAEVDEEDAVLEHFEAVLDGAVAAAASAPRPRAAVGVSDDDGRILAAAMAAPVKWDVRARKWRDGRGAMWDHKTITGLTTRKLLEQTHPHERIITDSGRAAIGDGG